MRSLVFVRSLGIARQPLVNVYPLVTLHDRRSPIILVFEYSRSSEPSYER